MRNYLIISIGIFLALYSNFIENPYMDIFRYLFGIVVWFSILGSDREPASKLIWLVVIPILPLLSCMLFISFGQSYQTKNIYQAKVRSDKIFDHHLNIKKYSIIDNTQTRILTNLGHETIYLNTEVKIIKNGEGKYRELFKMITNATSYIHLEYYIISDGKLVEALIDLLCSKAAGGVEVRILYDAVGGGKLSRKSIKKLKNANVKIASFGNVLLPYFNNTINLRNHRKIAIVDGVAIVGGSNIADEYIGFSKKYGYWEDMHVRIKGDAVRALQITFSRDWFYSTKENFIISDEKYLIFENIQKEDVAVQIIHNGADNKKVSTKDIYFKLITTATNEIIIFTPYLIPDSDIIKALKTASENKVSVKIFVPGVPDKKYVHGLTRTFYQRLLDSDVRIYELDNSFLHSKVLIIDDELVTIGTTNIDYRSFNLNFEITTFINSKKENQILKKVASNYEKRSTEITTKNWTRRPYINRYGANLVQLFAPLF